MENVPPVPPIPPNNGLARHILAGVVLVSLSVAGASAVYLVVKHKGGLGPGKGSSAPASQVQTDYDDLKKKFESLEADRNNVLAQTKNLLEEKAEWTEGKAQLENLQKTNKLFMAQKDKILSDNQKLKNDLATLLENFDSLKGSYQELQAKQDAAEKENANLRDLLTRQVEATPQFQVLDRESKRLREENTKLGETISVMGDRIKKALDRINKDQAREVSQVRQIREQNQALLALRSQNGSLSQGNSELNDLIDQAPDKMRQMAAQNSALVKETSEMHYNMAVFFTDNKQFERAEKEYLRALDFDPNNLKVHYNLGYLYAEDLDKKEKAAYHLEKYLQIDPDSKESEAVRSYLTTLSVWNGSVRPKKS
jgi:tetratricopeptide (TPR) repeat protein